MKAHLRRREQRALRRLTPRRLLVLSVMGGKSRATYGVVNDISDSGAGIVADHLLPLGRDVRLRICFYPQVCFDTEARVVWGRKASDARDTGHGLALNGVLFAGPLDLGTLGPHEALDAVQPSREETVAAASLDYLRHQIPDYPFDRKLDEAFVGELLADFPGVDLLEEIKTFRWNYDSDPVAHVQNPRVALRRWVSFSTPSPLRERNGHALMYGSANGNGGNGAGGASLGREAFTSWVSFLRA